VSFSDASVRRLEFNFVQYWFRSEGLDRRFRISIGVSSGGVFRSRLEFHPEGFGVSTGVSIGWVLGHVWRLWVRPEVVGHVRRWLVTSGGWLRLEVVGSSGGDFALNSSGSDTSRPEWINRPEVVGGVRCCYIRSSELVRSGLVPSGGLSLVSSGGFLVPSEGLGCSSRGVNSIGDAWSRPE
ncbi:hypothetical protein Tco_0202225, partial [Tanacetum coccineum]